MLTARTLTGIILAILTCLFATAIINHARLEKLEREFDAVNRGLIELQGKK